MSTLPDLPAVLDAVRILSPISTSPDHGEAHWRRVAGHGLDLAREVGGDQLVVVLFGIFHDCMRFDEYADPDHGKRGGFLACCLNGELLRFDEDRLDLLYTACAEHTDGFTSKDPTIGACWDADRLDLCRFDTEIIQGAISTAPGRTDPVQVRARALLKNTPDWASIFWSLEPTAGAFHEVLRRRREPASPGSEPAAGLSAPPAAVAEPAPRRKPAPVAAEPEWLRSAPAPIVRERLPIVPEPAPPRREPRKAKPEPLLVAREPSPHSPGPAHPRPQPPPDRSAPTPPRPQPAPVVRRPIATEPVEGRHYWTATLIHAEPASGDAPSSPAAPHPAAPPPAAPGAKGNKPSAEIRGPTKRSR